MADLHPPSDNDQLLDRLAAAGPVLDDLFHDASRRPPTPDRRHRTPGRRPHHDRHTGRQAMVALVAVCITVGGFLGAVALSQRGDDARTVVATSPDSTTTTESDAQLQARVRTRIDAVSRCAPTPSLGSWPSNWVQIGGGPDCATGFVDDVSGTAGLVPVYPTPAVTDPVGYWSGSIGWLTLDEAEAPGFDLDRYQAAYQAELQSRIDQGGGS